MRKEKKQIDLMSETLAEIDSRLDKLQARKNKLKRQIYQVDFIFWTLLIFTASLIFTYAGHSAYTSITMMTWFILKTAELTILTALDMIGREP